MSNNEEHYEEPSCECEACEQHREDFHEAAQELIHSSGLSADTIDTILYGLGYGTSHAPA